MGLCCCASDSLVYFSFDDGKEYSIKKKSLEPYHECILCTLKGEENGVDSEETIQIHHDSIGFDIIIDILQGKGKLFNKMSRSDLISFREVLEYYKLNILPIWMKNECFFNSAQLFQLMQRYGVTISCSTGDPIQSEFDFFFNSEVSLDFDCILFFVVIRVGIYVDSQFAYTMRRYLVKSKQTNIKSVSIRSI